MAGERSWSTYEDFERLYDGAILQADDAVRRLIKDMERQDAINDTLVIVTSDHGEGFNERSNVDRRARLLGHMSGIHEVMTHVPLVVKYPGEKGDETVSQLASLINIPEVIKMVIDDRTDTDYFIETKTLSSAFKLLPESARKFDDLVESEAFVGPWRAVYQDKGEHIVKFAKRGDDTAVIGIASAQDHRVNIGGDASIVENTFNSLNHVDLTTSAVQEDVSEDTKERLEKLGYIR
jgi:hypothetical protein